MQISICQILDITEIFPATRKLPLDYDGPSLLRYERQRITCKILVIPDIDSIVSTIEFPRFFAVFPV